MIEMHFEFEFVYYFLVDAKLLVLYKVLFKVNPYIKTQRKLSHLLFSGKCKRHTNEITTLNSHDSSVAPPSVCSERRRRSTTVEKSPAQ
jgi:hypothetical protein